MWDQACCCTQLAESVNACSSRLQPQVQCRSCNFNATALSLLDRSAIFLFPDCWLGQPILLRSVYVCMYVCLDQIIENRISHELRHSLKDFLARVISFMIYRTAVTLGQKINILGAAQTKKTKVETLPNCPNGYKLLIKSQNSICPTENTENANNCPLQKISNGSKFKFPVAQLQKWT
jgi:hypothetical protein